MTYDIQEDYEDMLDAEEFMADIKHLIGLGELRIEVDEDGQERLYSSK